MELKEARTGCSIGNAQSVLVVTTEIYGLPRSEHDWLAMHDKLERAFKYYEHAFRVWVVMHAGNRISFVDHDHRVTPLRFDRIVIYKIDTLLFLHRQIEHWRLSALSHREFACKPGCVPTIRPRGCDDLDYACQRAALILDGELNALLHDRKRLCGEWVPTIGYRNGARALDRKQVTVRTLRHRRGPSLCRRDTDVFGGHLLRFSLSNSRALDAASDLARPQIRKRYNSSHAISPCRIARPENQGAAQ
jgi:hypothetical protein